jgi:hypothetical protein
MKQASWIVFFAAALAFGQQQPSSTPRGFGELFNQAPPHVDQALRARVQTFYQLHQEKKFRQADKLVHEDSKDIFFEADKTTFRGFKIVGVSYEENYTRARVVIDIDTDFFFPGFGQMQVNRPLTSMWKLDGNEWWWYALPCDPNVGKDSPFNYMFKGCKGSGPEETPAPPPDPKSTVLGAPMSMQDFQRALSELKSKVQVDKNQVVFPSHEAAEAEIVVSNGWDQPVHLSIDVPELPGLTLTVEKPVLEAGQKTRVRIVSKPETRGAKPAVRAQLTAEEISKVIPIEITFLPPPNTELKPGTRISPAQLPKP